MKVELIGLSQGISFEKKQATNYLDFRKDSGELFRLEVPETVAETLLSIMLNGGQADPTPPAALPAPPDIDETPEEATTFGGDEPPEIPEEEPVVMRPMSHIGPSVESEEEVPSL